jgi:hypothetical protein
VAEIPTEEFFDRVNELQELHEFVLTSPQTVFLLIGKMGMGKSKIVREFHRQLRNKSNFLVPDISVLYGAQSPEEFASDLNHKLTDRRFMLWRPEDPTTIRRAFGIVPLVGPLIQALIKDQNKPERIKLEGILNLLGRNIKRWVVLILDPYDAHIERSDYVDFFTMLVHRLPSTVKLIVPQRPGDVLAASTKFLSLPAVTTNKNELKPLPKSHAYQLADSLIPNCAEKEQLLDQIWRDANGWPLLISWQARSYARGEEVKDSIDLDQAYSRLLEVANSSVRQLLFAIALAPLGIYREDLPETSGLRAEELEGAINNRTIRESVESFEQFGAKQVRIFHASLRDYLLKHMAQIGVVEEYASRLNHKLVKDAIAVYGRMGKQTVTERDAAALHYSRKLRTYEKILREGDQSRKIAITLLKRIDSLAPGGRSFSLYSLLVLARANALTVNKEEGEQFLKAFYTVLIEDSFLHPEYALLLLGVLISEQELGLNAEAVETCKQRILLMANAEKQDTKSRVAHLVRGALEEGLDPLKSFELEEMLPASYFEEPLVAGENLASAHFESEMARLIRTPVSDWSPEQRYLMERYIRFKEVKASM